MKFISGSMMSTCAAVILTFSTLNAQSIQKTQAEQTQPLPKVDIYKVHSARSVPVNFSYPARLSAFQTAVVTSRVTGVLISKHYTEGHFVKKGQILYRIEPDAYKALANERKSDVEIKKAALANAQREWDRVQSLASNNAISKREFDASLSSYEMAKADLNAAKARWQSATIDLGYTTVKAPVSGIAGMKITDVGNVVTPGTSLVNITQIDPIYAEFSIPDVDLNKAGYSLKTLAKSKNLHVSFTYNNQTYTGAIDYIDPVINIKTGGIKMRAKLHNSDNFLMPGIFGRIMITGIQSPAAITVPQKAVLQSKAGMIVMVAEKGIVGVRPITIGNRIGDQFIVKNGLKGGENVIVNNFFRIKPGAHVTIDKIINVQGK